MGTRPRVGEVDGEVGDYRRHGTRLVRVAGPDLLDGGCLNLPERIRVAMPRVALEFLHREVCVSQCQECDGLRIVQLDLETRLDARDLLRS